MAATRRHPSSIMGSTKRRRPRQARISTDEVLDALHYCSIQQRVAEPGCDASAEDSGAVDEIRLIRDVLEAQAGPMLIACAKCATAAKIERREAGGTAEGNPFVGDVPYWIQAILPIGHPDVHRRIAAQPGFAPANTGDALRRRHSAERCVGHSVDALDVPEGPVKRATVVEQVLA